MAQVLDYSSGFPGALAIARAGYVGAVRYIGFPDRRKCTTRAELEDFSRNGLGMALAYEDNADDWRAGLARGREAGVRARNHANAIGFPRGRPIYMAVDRDVVTPVEFSVMIEYLRGASQTLGGVASTGVYGEHDVCARAARDGVAAWFWQCRAWSGTPIRYFDRRHLFQRVGLVKVGGVDCDINDVMRADWGQHNHQEDDMDDELVRGLKYVIKVIYALQQGSNKLEPGDYDNAGQDIQLAKTLDALAWRAQDIANLEDKVTGGIAFDTDLPLVALLKEMRADIDELKNRPAADVDAAAAKIADRLIEHGATGITPDQVKAALTEVLDQTSLTVRGGAAGV